MGSSSTMRAAARKGFDWPMARLPCKWRFVHDPTWVKNQAAELFGSGHKRLGEFGTNFEISVFCTIFHQDGADMTAIKGAAVVTGAASGIGRALALELALRGCDLALADRDEAGLQAVAAEIATASQRKVTLHRVDVSEPGQIAEFAQAATSAHPALNIVINNAGVALLGHFDEIDQAQMDWLFNINFWGVVHSTRAFLPHLARQPAAHIVNLSSIFGIVAPPGQTAYAAAKFAVRGFSESLRHELQMTASPARHLLGRAG